MNNRSYPTSMKPVERPSNAAMPGSLIWMPTPSIEGWVPELANSLPSNNGPEASRIGRPGPKLSS